MSYFEISRVITIGFKDPDQSPEQVRQKCRCGRGPQSANMMRWSIKAGEMQVPCHSSRFFPCLQGTSYDNRED